jgi:demethylmenaquinone methyltransferase/2-methoxy-6-polyprenyl-1,4-benzoquinol methylase
MAHPPDGTTHFGFESVAETEKAGRVQGVFASVSSPVAPATSHFDSSDG